MASKTIRTSAGYQGTLSVTANGRNITATINTGGTNWEGWNVSIEILVDGVSQGSTSCRTVSKNTNYSATTYISGYGSHTITARWNGNSSVNYIYPSDSIDDYVNYPLPTYDHHIDYDANGGTGAPSRQTITNTSQYSFEATLSATVPTRNGYEFVGWFCSKDFETYYPNTQYTFGYSDVTLSAIWKPLVKIKVNGEWKGTSKSFVKINGLWKETKKIFAKVNGVWKS